MHAFTFLKHNLSKIFLLHFTIVSLGKPNNVTSGTKPDNVASGSTKPDNVTSGNDDDISMTSDGMMSSDGVASDGETEKNLDKAIKEAKTVAKEGKAVLASIDKKGSKRKKGTTKTMFATADEFSTVMEHLSMEDQLRIQQHPTEEAMVAALNGYLESLFSGLSKLQQAAVRAKEGNIARFYLMKEFYEARSNKKAKA